MTTSQGPTAAPSFPGHRHVPPGLSPWHRPSPSQFGPRGNFSQRPPPLLGTLHTQAAPSSLVPKVKRPRRTCLFIHPHRRLQTCGQLPALASPQTPPTRPVRQGCAPVYARACGHKASSGASPHPALPIPTAPCFSPSFDFPFTPLNHVLQEGKPLCWLVSWTRLKAATKHTKRTGSGSGRKPGHCTQRTPLWSLTEVRCCRDSPTACRTRRVCRDQSVRAYREIPTEGESRRI